MRLLASGTLAIVAALLLAAPAAATDQSGVPAALRVPDGHDRVLHTTGVGVQIYDCVASAWVFREPKAGIFEHGRLVATHFAGPTWKSTKDDSSVVGAVRARAAAPDPARDIPWLLLGATANTGSGVFSEVDYIQRLDTRGGVAPAGPCETGKAAYVPYAATYDFWAPAA